MDDKPPTSKDEFIRLIESIFNRPITYVKIRNADGTEQMADEGKLLRVTPERMAKVLQECPELAKYACEVIE